ncbi:hypothetical protein Avbf_01537 [Armadillidium vulgare]|nr:hypothetical protein Avbf_01537 [Armadillidium vulgare]
MGLLEYLQTVLKMNVAEVALDANAISLGSLRRRFSRSKLRSKSVDPTSGRVDIGDVVTGGRRDVSLDRDPLAGRSVSMERSASRLSSYGRSRAFLSVPKFIRGRSSPSGGTGVGSGDSESTRSSLSGTSGLSSASAKTYINEASILVVETLENGVIKHYLVPLSLQRKNKWKKKGTKLHIYNEHTFVAKQHVKAWVILYYLKNEYYRHGSFYLKNEYNRDIPMYRHNCPFQGQRYKNIICRMIRKNDNVSTLEAASNTPVKIANPNLLISSSSINNSSSFEVPSTPTSWEFILSGNRVYVKDDKANNKNSRLNS